MQQHDTSSHPWYHPYYSLIKHLYHPFLYHNQYYCELTLEQVNHMLSERESYAKITDPETGYIPLTPTERSWVLYLRDCCLFEIHRRNYKPVLKDILKLRFQNLKDAQKARFYAFRRAVEWVKSNSARFKNRDYLIVADNDPEGRANHCATCLDKTTQCPSISELTGSVVSEPDQSLGFTTDAAPVKPDEVKMNVIVDEITESPLSPHWKWMVVPSYSRDSFDSARENMPSTSTVHASTSTHPPGASMDPTSGFEASLMNLLSLETKKDQQQDNVQ